jgi:hypothetical protein
VLPGEAENDGFIAHLGGGHGVLRDHLVLILDFHGNGFVGEESRGFRENGGEFSGGEAVIVVVTDPNLQLAGVGLAEGASAIEERLPDPADLGDVEGHGNRISVGKKEPEGAVGMGLEEVLEFAEGHGRGAGWEGFREMVFFGRGQQEAARAASRFRARAASEARTREFEGPAWKVSESCLRSGRRARATR